MIQVSKVRNIHTLTLISEIEEREREPNVQSQEKIIIRDYCQNLNLNSLSCLNQSSSQMGGEREREKERKEQVKKIYRST